MKPSIFISHSCKDRELEPRAGLSTTEQRERFDRLTFARRVRQNLMDRLVAADRYDVWLDQRSLRPGDEWRDGINRALRDCSAAVLLLSPEAIESAWVLKEATVLAWRSALGEPVLVVPLLLGVSNADLRARGFDPAGLAVIQSETVDGDRDVDRAVDRIVQVFADRLPDRVTRADSDWSTKVEQWTAETARLLHENDEHYPREMFRILGLDYEDRTRFGDPFATVAAELLDARTDTILDVLHVLAGVRSPSQKQQLRQAVAAMWVSATAAHRLPAVANLEAPRVAAIDGVEPLTGHDYVQRAYCGKLRGDRIFMPDDRTDGTVAQILARIEDLLDDYLPIEDPVELAEDVRRNGPVFVVLGAGASREDVLIELTRRYPPLTFVAMMGGGLDALGSMAGRVRQLTPALAAGERAGRRYRNRLAAYG